MATRSAMLLAILGLASVSLCLGASLAAVAADDLLPNWVQHETDIGMSFGFGFGVVSLAALWTSLGPFRFFTRAPLALLLVVLSGTVMTCFYLVDSPGTRDLAVVVTLWVAVILQWACLASVLFLIRRLLRFRVDLAHAPRPSGSQAAQFGIRQMLLWTTGAALTLGVMRVLIGIAPAISDLGDFARMTTTFALLLAFNLALAVPWTWALLGVLRPWLRLLAACLAVAALTWLEGPIFHLCIGPSGDSALFWWLNGCGSACLIANLFIVRLCAYRLVPEPR